MKKIIFLLGVFITLFGGTLLVNAEMNITGVSYEVVSNSLIKIKLIGTLDSSDEYGYFAYFVKDTDSAPQIPENSSSVQISDPSSLDFKKFFALGGIDNNEVLINSDFYMYDGYTGLYVAECNAASCTLSERLAFDKPALPDYGFRYDYYFQKNKLYLFPQYVHLSDLNYTVKIGKIDDPNLRINILNGNYNKEDLLNYAINATNGSTFNTTMDSVLISDGISTTGLSVTDCELYYVYIANDTSNGKYIDAKDIYVVMGDIDSDGNPLLAAYRADDDALNRCGVNLNNGNGNLNNGNGNTGTVKNPDTNINPLLFITIPIILVIGLIVFAIYKLHNNYYKMKSLDDK